MTVHHSEFRERFTPKDLELCNTEWFRFLDQESVLLDRYLLCILLLLIITSLDIMLLFLPRRLRFVLRNNTLLLLTRVSVD